MHNVDDKHRHIAKRGASCSQVGERLVAWRVDDEEAGQLQVELLSVIHALQEFNQICLREPGCTDLLGNTASLAGLDVGSSKFVKDERLACVDVTHDTNDRTSELLLLCLFTSPFDLFEALFLKFHTLCSVVLILAAYHNVVENGS